jgi:hypothetical protein
VAEKTKECYRVKIHDGISIKMIVLKEQKKPPGDFRQIVKWEEIHLVEEGVLLIIFAIAYALCKKPNRMTWKE